ncbi:MAG TPA: hypothetical protein VFE30_15905 [Anaeromyxobacteraceae bacterium]|jgi:hypothetical protein|nr:hypothetical protein [Anaeromyxobacteraceae bacterium]
MEHTGGIVVAGSRPFVRAVTAAFRQHGRVVVGIAGETESDFVLANASGGLFVFEYCGAQWRTLVERLALVRGAGLRMVAALPAASAEGEADRLEQAGVDVVALWDGQTADFVVAGAEALLEERAAAASAPPFEPGAALPDAPAESGTPAVRWDPRSRMAPLARVVDGPPSRWERLGEVLGSLLAAAALAGAALYGVAG